MKTILTIAWLLMAPLALADKIRHSFFEVAARPEAFDQKRVNVFGFAIFQSGPEECCSLFPTKEHVVHQVAESAAFLEMKDVSATAMAALQDLPAGSPVRITGVVSLKKGTWDLFQYTIKVESVEVLPVTGSAEAAPGHSLPFDDTPLVRLGCFIKETGGKYEKAEAVLRMRSGIFVAATLCEDKHKLETLQMVAAIPTIEAVYIAIRTSSDMGDKEVATLAKISALKTLSLGGTDDHLAAIDWKGLSGLNSLEALSLSVSTCPVSTTKALTANAHFLHVPKITIRVVGEMPPATALGALEDLRSKLQAAVPGRFSTEISESKGPLGPSISITYTGGGTFK